MSEREIPDQVVWVVEISMRVVALALLAWIAFDGTVILMAEAMDWIGYGRLMTMILSSAALGVLANILRASQ